MTTPYRQNAAPASMQDLLDENRRLREELEAIEQPHRRPWWALPFDVAYLPEDAVFFCSLFGGVLVLGFGAAHACFLIPALGDVSPYVCFWVAALATLTPLAAFLIYTWKSWCESLKYKESTGEPQRPGSLPPYWNVTRFEGYYHLRDPQGKLVHVTSPRTLAGAAAQAWRIAKEGE